MTATTTPATPPVVRPALLPGVLLGGALPLGVAELATEDEVAEDGVAEDNAVPPIALLPADSLPPTLWLGLSVAAGPVSAIPPEPYCSVSLPPGVGPVGLSVLGGLVPAPACVVTPMVASLSGTTTVAPPIVTLTSAQQMERIRALRQGRREDYCQRGGEGRYWTGGGGGALLLVELDDEWVAIYKASANVGGGGAAILRRPRPRAAASSCHQASAAGVPRRSPMGLAPSVRECVLSGDKQPHLMPCIVLSSRAGVFRTSPFAAVYTCNEKIQSTATTQGEWDVRQIEGSGEWRRLGRQPCCSRPTSPRPSPTRTAPRSPRLGTRPA